MRNINLVEVRSELAAGTRGASLGIDAVKIASLDRQSDYFTRFDPIKVPDANEMLWKGNRFPYAKYIDGVLEVLSNVSETIQKLRTEGVFPIVLAGDHATSAGTIMGIKAAHPDLRLGVIWIDAHADLHSPFTTPTGNMHGMPLAMATATDNKTCQLNNPGEESIKFWEKIKSLGGPAAKIDLGDIVYIGLRSTEPAEDFLIEKHKIKVFTIEKVREEGIDLVAEKTLAALQNCQQIYISFDVDSLDSSISKGTGTPVPEGLTYQEAIGLNTQLIKDNRVCCWEIVEVNPTLDTENTMAEIAFDILESTTQALIANF
ncbi:MAG TPA: arginase [Cyclobacteriaceae bacterium]|nr:arginase [Cyclobacteriaceae bacterium]